MGAEMNNPQVVRDVADVLDRIEDIAGEGWGEAIMRATMLKMDDSETYEDLLARLRLYLKKISN